MLYQNWNIYSSVSFTLLFICYQLLPTEINGKICANFKRSGSKPQYFLLIKYFKCHQYILFQKPTKKHPWEGGIQTQGVQSRDIWASSGSWEQCIPIPRAPHPSTHLMLHWGTTRTTRHLLCRGQLQGAEGRKTHKETNPYPHRWSTVQKSAR